MKYKEKIEILHETECHIKGNEPFLDFLQTGVIVNLYDRSGRSHNFIDALIGGANVPIDTLKKGETLRFQMTRVSLVPMTWWELVWSWAKGLK